MLFLQNITQREYVTTSDIRWLSYQYKLLLFITYFYRSLSKLKTIEEAT